jgi:hypothetical protein
VNTTGVDVPDSVVTVTGTAGGAGAGGATGTTIVHVVWVGQAIPAGTLPNATLMSPFGLKRLVPVMVSVWPG